MKQSITGKHNYSVKGVKTFRGHDGYGWEASLYNGKKRVATATDDGWGGGLQYHWLVAGEEKIMNDFIKKQPPYDYNGSKLDACSDVLIGDMVNLALENKEFKRKCKTKTLVITKDCKDGEYFPWDYAYTPKLKAHIEKHYGDKLKEIINERFVA